MILRCTRRLLDLLGGGALILTDLAPTDEDWYANLLWLDRRKCLLLTHAGTLFSVFLPGVRTADLRQAGMGRADDGRRLDLEEELREGERLHAEERARRAAPGPGEARGHDVPGA